MRGGFGGCPKLHFSNVSGAAQERREAALSMPTLKREAVQKLSLMRSKEATDYMMELLK